MSRYIIGSDVGTTNLKTVLVDESGRIIQEASCGYKLYSPKDGFAEQNPEEWWIAFKETIQRILNDTNISAKDIKVVSISSQSSTVLPLDKQWKPLSNAIIWMDNRGKEYCGDIQEIIGQIENKKNFNNVEAFFTISKLYWLKKNKPDVYSQTEVFIQANSYIIFKLTGEFTIDRSEAGLQHVIDIDKAEYSEKICNALDLDYDKFPAIKDCSEIIGEINGAASRETSLIPGTSVTAGTVDTSAAALAAGTISDGQVFYSAGTSGNLCYCSRSLAFDKSFFVFPHAKDDLWLFDMLMGTVGINVEWLCKIIGSITGPKKEACLEELNTRIEKRTSQKGNPIFLPFLSGQLSPVWKTNAKGIFFGLSINTSEAQIARSIMEGCAFEARDNIEKLKGLGFSVDEIRLVGGVTSSRVWNQIWADVLNLPILIPYTGGSAYGAALLAGESSGIYQNLTDNISDFVSIKNTYTPHKDNVEFYEKAYQIYRNIVDKMQAEWDNYEKIQRCADE